MMARLVRFFGSEMGFGVEVGDTTIGGPIGTSGGCFCATSTVGMVTISASIIASVVISLNFLGLQLPLLCSFISLEPVSAVTTMSIDKQAGHDCNVQILYS